VMSMARAFEIAGCPATIVSLWSIPDSSTAAIMQRFHAYQSLGTPKDLSLQKAKLDYLMENQSGQFALPNYWAATEVIGDISPVICPAPKTSLYVCLVGAAITLVVALFLFFKKRR